MSSDHCAVWIDIQAANVGMTQQETIVRPAGRRLKCQDPRIVVKYTKALAQEIDNRGWALQVETLYTTAEMSRWSAQHSNQYNELDRELTQAKLRAEQHCRKLSASHIPWTPALTQAIQQIQYWKGIAKRAFGGKISTTVLKRQAAMGQLSFSNTHWELSTSTLNKRIKSAYNDYYMIKAQKDHRDTWLGQLIEAISSAKDIPKARLWKHIQHNEAACTQARQVCKIFCHNQTRSGLTQVNIPDSNQQGGRIMVHNKASLEKACLEEAHKCFTQAANSPIFQLPAETGLHSGGVGSIAFQKILARTYDMSDISNPYTVKLLSHLSRPPDTCKLTV